MQQFQKQLSWWLGRAPQHPLSPPSSFRGVEGFYRLVVMQTFNNVQTNGCSCSPIHGTAHITVLKTFLSGWYEIFQKHANRCLGRAPPNTTQFLSRCWTIFWLDIMQPLQKLSSWWLGRAPQHPLSQPSSLRGVEKSFRFSLMQFINSVQMNGWSCSPKHGPAHITVLSQLFARMAWSFSKTFNT